MAQLFTPSATEAALGFSGDESDADLGMAASGTEDDAPDPVVPQAPAPTPEPTPAAPQAPPAAPEQSQGTQPPQAPPAAPEPTLAEVLARMEAQAQRQTQILERAVPQAQPQPPQPPAHRPLPVIPEQYRGVIDEDTLRGAQLVMDILGVTPALEELNQFRQAAVQKESGNAAGEFITSQVPEMKDPAFQQEVAAEVERQFDAAGVPKEARAQFLNPFLFVQAGNAVKSRRGQNAAPAAPTQPTPSVTQALATRAGGETQTDPVAASVSETSQQPVDWMSMSEEDYAKAQAAILRKQNGSW